MSISGGLNMRKIKFSKIITVLGIIIVVLFSILGIYILKNIFFYNSISQSSASEFTQQVINPIQSKLSDNLKATEILNIRPYAGNNGIDISLQASENEIKDNLLDDIRFINDDFAVQIKEILLDTPLVQEHETFEFNIYYNGVATWELWSAGDFEPTIYLYSGFNIELFKKCTSIKSIIFQNIAETDIKKLPQKWYENFKNLESLTFYAFNNEDILYFSEFSHLKSLKLNICGNINLEYLSIPDNNIILTLKRENYTGSINYVPLAEKIKTDWLNVEDDEISVDECEILAHYFKNFYLNRYKYQ